MMKGNRLWDWSIGTSLVPNCALTHTVPNTVLTTNACNVNIKQVGEDRES
jgi:hypothetical protein